MTYLAPIHRAADPVADPFDGRESLLDGDRVDFDAWLLPPAPQSALERATRFASRAAGVLCLGGVLAAVIAWIVAG